jgi:NAD(P)-dependent dehydrogenase (short-subunit alcohol dehydrogenase family)
MKVILIGAAGTLGQFIARELEDRGHELVRVGRRSGDWHADLEDLKSLEELFARVEGFDAVVNASGDVAFAPLAELSAEQWNFSLRSKLMGQVHLVQKALVHLKPGGSITLTSGVLSDEPIDAGVAASTINRAIEGFVMAAAAELIERGVRINVVSPGLLTESLPKYGEFFPGFATVPGAKVAQAYLKSILGVQSGQIFRAV